MYLIHARDSAPIYPSADIQCHFPATRLSREMMLINPSNCQGGEDSEIPGLCKQGRDSLNHEQELPADAKHTVELEIFILQNWYLTKRLQDQRLGII